jgi:uncharacterized protein YkwD
MRTFAALLTAAMSSFLVALSATPMTTAASGAAGFSNKERAVVRAINSHRRAHGLRRVRPSGRLASAASYHTGDMLAWDYFSHTSRDGTPFATRIRRFARFRAVGETLAMLGRCRAGRTVRMWMNSPGHRSVLLSRSYRRVGVGARSGRLGSQRTCVVTADFGGRG